MALGFIGKTKYGHNCSEVYCDICAHEKIYPMFHETLYKIEGLEAYCCEIHAILLRRRPETPGFAVALLMAQEKASADKLARLDADLQAATVERERQRISVSGKQSGRSEDCQD